jgi:secondary thiamine-phosphate synthase enzyme
MFEEFLVKTHKKEEILDITPEVKKIAEKSKIKEGICLIYAKHATASIIINENYDPNVGVDILSALDRIIPEHADYKHNCIDNNAAAHIKAAVTGPGKVIPIKDSKMQLGQWQSITLAEFDGPRERHVIIEIIGS